MKYMKAKQQIKVKIVPTIFPIEYKIKDSKLIYLFKFTAYFTILTGLIVLAKDLFIIHRITLMWLPLFIIILLYSINEIKNKKL